MHRLLLTAATLLALAPAVHGQKPAFHADSAFQHVRHLAETIGPRPMGSDGERRALTWAAERFRRLGADSAWVMPLERTSREINTRSGTAVGIFRGISDTTIVIGGHIDSDRPENPGASDNASGTAVVMELARIWSQARRPYTLVFCAFGAEEAGLEGSRVFVDRYGDLDKVALMISIDMAASESPLIPFIDLNTHQAPRWLVEDAFAVDRALGYNSLRYPTHFFTLNSIGSGGAGSDHMPFMREDIPAIDFTCGVNTDPIHTPNDRLEFVSVPMLARSGNIVDGMITRYMQQGIPAPRTDRYMLLQSWMGLTFLPWWAVAGLTGLFAVLGVLGWLQARKMRLTLERKDRVLTTGLKIIFFAILLAVFIQLGEILMGVATGWRYPWMTHLDSYLTYAGVWALAGLWVVLFLTRFLRFTPDPYPYARNAYLLLILMTGAAAFASPRLALYPALSLFLLTLSTAMPLSVVRIVAGLLVPLPLLRLVFMEMFPLFARSFAMAGTQFNAPGADAIITAIFTIVLTLVLLPGMFSLGRTVAGEKAARLLARWARTPLVGLAVLVVLSVYTGLVYGLPAYGDKWKPMVRVSAAYDHNSGTGSLNVNGNDYLRGLTIRGEGIERHYTGDRLRDSLAVDVRADWLTVSDSVVFASAAGDTLDLLSRIISKRPWSRLSLSFFALRGGLETLSSDWAVDAASGDTYRMVWQGDFPDTLTVPVRATLAPGDTLVRELNGIFVGLPVDLSVESDLASIVYRTTVTRLDTLVLP